MDENMDFSKAVEKIQDMLSSDEGQNVISNLLSSFSTSSDSDEESCTEETPSPASDNNPFEFNLDIDMLFKLQKILNATKNQSNTEKTQFLYSLKPFLKPSRRTRLDSAVKLMNTLSVLKVLKNNDKGGD